MLETSIEQDFRQALKAKDEIQLSTLRMLKSALHNQKISSKKSELSDQEVLKIVASEVKRRRDSIIAYQEGNRPELAAKEQAEIEILTKYLPAQLSEEEIKQIVEKTMAANPEAKDNIGLAMGKVMPQLKGRADGNLVKKIVKDILES